MKDPASYEAVFSDKFPIDIWPKIASILKLVDQGIGAKLPKTAKVGQRIVATWRGATALCSVAEVFGQFDYSIEQLLGFDLSTLSTQRIGEIFEYVTSTEVSPQPPRGRVDLVCMKFATENNLDGSFVLGRASLPSNLGHRYAPPSIPRQNTPTLGEEKIRLVASVLPPQPWKPGVQQRAAKETGLSLKDTRLAIKQLIEQGAIHNQINGVVFDKNRVIVAIDRERSKTPQKVGDVYSAALN